MVLDRFGEDVSFLGFGMYVVDSDSSPDVRHELIVLESDVLRPGCKMMSSSHSDARLIVFPNLAVEVRLINMEGKHFVYFFHLGHQGNDLA